MAELDTNKPVNLENALLFEQAEVKADDPGRKNYGSLRTLSVDTFQTLYFEEGKTLRQIGDIFGVSGAAVYQWVRDNVRPFLKLRRVSRASKYQLNEAFFDFWYPAMAYVLGVLATDGNVSRYRMTLTSTDLELVEKVRSLIGSSLVITERPPRGWSRKIQYSLSVSSLKFVTALGKLGVSARKSLTLRLPRMPKRCVRHFLRGCWDGDGSFYFEKRGNAFRASFVSGSRHFIEGFVSALKDIDICSSVLQGGRHVKTGDPISIYELRRGNSISYSFRLSGENAILFGKFLYESVPESMYLKRKYEVFRSALTGSDQPPGT